MDKDLKSVMTAFKALSCLDCGKCTANCPVAPHVDFSPRRTIARMTSLTREAFLDLPDIWECLTCGMCAERCPSDVRFTQVVKSLRDRAAATGRPAPCAHAGALHAMMRLSAEPEQEPQRLAWLTDDLRVADKGDVLYHVGCLPQFDIYFQDLNLGLTDIARSAVRILNSMDIAPAMLPQEGCCGHDLLWTGDRDGFRRLAEANVEAIEATGCETVVCTCAECYYTLKYDVPQVLGRHSYDVVHMSEFLKHKMLSDKFHPEGNGQTLTFHDPCRLGRLGGVYDDPREVLEKVSTVVEMEHARHAAVCCGTSHWQNCNAASMAVQKRRLGEAQATGADAMVTACPKCLIHFHCAQQKNEAGDVPAVPVRDFTQVVAESLE